MYLATVLFSVSIVCYARYMSCLADDYDKWYMCFWSAVGWAFCVVSLHGPTVVLAVWSAVDFCVYFVNLRCADGYVIVLGNLHSAVCGFVRLCFDSTIPYFAHCFLLFHVEIVNTITLVILVCVVFWLANCSPQDPIIWSSAAQRTEGWFCASPRINT